MILKKILMMMTAAIMVSLLCKNVELQRDNSNFREITANFTFCLEVGLCTVEPILMDKPTGRETETSEIGETESEESLERTKNCQTQESDRTENERGSERETQESDRRERQTEELDRGESDVREIDEKEQKEVMKFLNDGCGCARKCSKKFDLAKVTDMRNNCAELSRDELDMLVMGEVLSSTSYTDETEGMHHIHQARQKPRSSYMFRGIKVHCSLK